MRPRMLVAYGMESTFTQTTRDYLGALKKYVGYDVEYLHVTHNAEVSVDLSRYDVVFHSYCARLCFENYVSTAYLERLRSYNGVKILAVQDEYNFTNRLRAAIGDLGFDIVLTCVPQDSREYVYPRADFPGVEFITVFTGYVPDDFALSMPRPKPLSERSIFIGYRGRSLGANYGSLGFDKYEIGRRMKQICEERGIQTDISMSEESRIYGAAWFDFIGDCRAMLGSESGSNVFDFDGSIEGRFATLTKQNGGREPTYEEFAPFIAEREQKISMGQISPRVFECAVMRTPLILFKGRYSDAITAGEHYIMLEKDFSNIDIVLARLEDISALEAMVERTYQHLVASGRFGYKSYGAMLQALIDRHLAKREPWLKGKVDAQPECAASAADELLLVEQPTQELGTHHEFRAKNLKRRGISSPDQISGFEALMDGAIARDMAALNSHARFLNELIERLATGGGVRGAAGRLALAEAQASLSSVRSKAALIEQARDRYKVEIETRGSGNRAAFLWLGQYANLYDNFRVAYVIATDQLLQHELRCVKLLRRRVGIQTLVRLGFRLATLRFAGSKLDHVKQLAKRSKTLRAWAPILMKMLRQTQNRAY